MYNTKEGKSCVIYIRVSSERQVKGYSLDGQKHYLAECAERRGMTVLFVSSSVVARCSNRPHLICLSTLESPGMNILWCIIST